MNWRDWSTAKMFANRIGRYGYCSECGAFYGQGYGGTGGSIDKEQPTQYCIGSRCEQDAMLASA